MNSVRSSGIEKFVYAALYILFDVDPSPILSAVSVVYETVDSKGGNLRSL
jgi:hypothetical protein